MSIESNLPNYFPEEFEKLSPVSAFIYNLFEKHLPTTGHLGLLVALILSTMCIDEQRQSNLVIGALPSEGKTSVLRNFYKIGFTNFFTSITKAQYLSDYCGLYLDPSCPPPSDELPKGVKSERVAGKTIISVSGCVDYINNRFDVCHAGEGIFTIGDFKGLVQLWNALLDERFYKGGNKKTGKFIIGSPSNPINHGLVLACTLNDLNNEWVKAEGLMSRVVQGVYYCLDSENEYIIQGRSPPRPRIRYVDFSEAVYNALQHLTPKQKIPVEFSEELTNLSTRIILDLVKEGRTESTGKRAMNDRINLLKAHAVLNKRNVATFDDNCIVESALLLCKKSIAGKDYFFGDRLNFQTNLRMHCFEEDEVVKQVMDTFKWWDSNDSLYSEERIRGVILKQQHIHKVYGGVKRKEEGLVFV